MCRKKTLMKIKFLYIAVESFDANVSLKVYFSKAVFYPFQSTFLSIGAFCYFSPAPDGKKTPSIFTSLFDERLRWHLFEHKKFTSAG